MELQVVADQAEETQEHAQSTWEEVSETPTAVSGGELTPPEQERLAYLEERIKAGIQTFVEVGNDLLEIRDSGLYRIDYATFQEYCERRWGWSRQRAYQLISAAEVAGTLEMSTRVDILPSSEKQARPLAKLKDPAERSAAWDEAVTKANGKQPTAAVVEEVVKRRIVSEFDAGALEHRKAAYPFFSARHAKCSVDLMTAFRSYRGNRRPKPGDKADKAAIGSLAYEAVGEHHTCKGQKCLPDGTLRAVDDLQTLARWAEEAANLVRKGQELGYLSVDGAESEFWICAVLRERGED
jgi:hypothetical protein